MSLEIFSKNLKYIRNKQGLSQQAFIRKIKVPANLKKVNRSQYGAWEEGRSFPSVALIPYLCNALGYFDVISLLTSDVSKTPDAFTHHCLPESIKEALTEIQQLAESVLSGQAKF